MSPIAQVHTYLPEALPKSRISVPDTPATTDEMARLTGGTEYVKLETLKANGERMQQACLAASLPPSPRRRCC